MNKNYITDWFAAMRRDWPLTKLPDEPKAIVLTRDVRVTGEDATRFYKIGGSIRTSGYRLFIDGTFEVPLDQLDQLMRG